MSMTTVERYLEIQKKIRNMDIYDPERDALLHQMADLWFELSPEDREHLSI